MRREGETAVILALVILVLVLLLCGLPLFAVLIGLTLLGLHVSGVDPAAIPIEITRLSNAPILLAIPLFTLAGYLLAHGKTSERLVRFSRSLFGWIPGGLSLVTLVSCAFFTAMTGATGVTIIALGGLLLPALLLDGYEERFALGILTISGSLGLLFPPSLPIILYGFVSGVSIEDLFVAGLLPGLLLLAAPCLYGMFTGSRGPVTRQGFSGKEFLASLAEARWELPIPALILLGIYSGFSTATETGALTVLYVFVIKVFVFKELAITRDLVPILRSSAEMVGGILIVLGTALGLTNYLVDALIPVRILQALEVFVHDRFTFLLALNLFLLLVGCMIDIFSAILIVVPLIVPMAARFGVDPLHMAIVFLVNLGIGYNTPPVGLNLFIASTRFEKPIVLLYRATLPFLVIQLLCLVLITYWPALSLFLPLVSKG